MSIAHLPPRLRPLVAYLEGLDARASIERVRALLEASDVIPADMSDFVVFDSDHCRRNLVSIGPCDEILVICWQSGQRSPIHYHAASTCGPKVLGGVCTRRFSITRPAARSSPSAASTSAPATSALRRKPTRTRCSPPPDRGPESRHTPHLLSSAPLDEEIFHHGTLGGGMAPAGLQVQSGRRHLSFQRTTFPMISRRSLLVVLAQKRRGIPGS